MTTRAPSSRWLFALALLTAVAPALAQRVYEVPTSAPADAPAETTMIESGEPGTPLVVHGTVLDAADDPVAGVSVFAYQTDAEGIYSEVGNRRPRIRGYARTDSEGRFVLRTIRPASYPGSSVQQHIHFVLDADQRSETTGEIVFADDPLLGERARRSEHNAVCEPEAAEDGDGVVCRVRLRVRGAAS